MVAAEPAPDDGPEDGIGASTAAGGGGGDPAAAGRAGGDAGRDGCDVSAGAAATAGGDVGDDGAAGWDARGGGAALEAEFGPSAGEGVDGARSALSTGRRGAGDGTKGDAVTAGIEAFAVGVAAPLAAPAEAAAVPGGGGGIAGAGGGAVPTPNSAGDEAGDDGSPSGASCAACCALVRSATSDAVSFFIASASGGAGLGGTVDRFGYASLAPGGGGRCSAIFPPSDRCHQFTGFIEDVEEQPLSMQAAAASAAMGPGARPRLQHSRADAA